MDELTGEFVAETRETLERIGEALIAWEANPADTTRLDEIFRFVHTVKGSCGFLDLPRIGVLAHAAETALGDVRAGRRVADTRLVGAILAIIDRVARLSEAIASDEAVPECDDGLIAGLDTATVCAPEVRDVASGHVRNVRIGVDVLETAMTQVSDLVLARNDLARELRGTDIDVRTRAAFDRLSSAIGEVRETIARTRMQPIERLFALLPRLVRDTAKSVGKTVRLRIEGSDVEIDREMIEAIRDPLMHIVRNAIDHGIEAASEREASGKPGGGTLTVIARQSGNQVSITVADDGRGIDIARLRAKAVALKLISPGDAAAMSAEAALALVFMPGLSTSEGITDISGRGVGMDVVRANVERLGGTIALDNRPGHGLAITLRAPLTLSIINALLVESGGQVVAIPRATIDEIVSVKSPSVRVEAIGGGNVAVIRGRMLSVVSLAAILCIRDEALSHLVVVDPPGGNRFALGVGRVRDHEELVVRPTAPHVAALGVYAGQSLPDNGVPVLVIDAAGIATRAGVDSVRQHRRLADVEVVADRPASVLLFDGLDGRRCAIRARDVGHIDDVDVGNFVSQGQHCYVRLDDRLMPVVLDGALPQDGRVVILRLTHPDGPVAYPVGVVHDLAPVPQVAPVGDGLVEGFVLIAGQPVPLIAWPRISTPKRIRRA